MRRRIGVGVGLVAVMLAITLLVCDHLLPAETQLRVGMSGDDVKRLMGQPDPFRIVYDHHGWDDEIDSSMVFFQGPDFLGNSRTMTVDFNKLNRVVGWQAEPHPRTYPPWLDQAMKSVGW